MIDVNVCVYLFIYLSIHPSILENEQNMGSGRMEGGDTHL